MALEVFMRVNKDGEDDGGTYIFCGKPADLRLLAAPLQDACAANRRLKKADTLANKIIEASRHPTPLVRLEKAEGQLLMDTLSAASQGKPASHRFSKLHANLENCLLVY